LVRLDLVDDAAAQQANHEDGAATTQYTEIELTDAHAHRNSLVALSRTLWQTLNLDEQFVKHSIHEGRGTFRALNCITNFSGIEPPEIVTPFGFLNSQGCTAGVAEIVRHRNTIFVNQRVRKTRFYISERQILTTWRTSRNENAARVHWQEYSRGPIWNIS
jgi:hypothetical protein